MTNTDTPIDVWLRIPEGEEESEAEANTFPDGRGYRVEWYLTAVGLVTTVWFPSLPEAYKWLEAEGFADFSTGDPYAFMDGVDYTGEEES